MFGITRIGWAGALIACLGLVLPVAAGESITIKGSDTLVHVSAKWAEAFMGKNKSIEISVTGGGSGTGIAALLNGTTDIANSSRNIEPKETKKAEEKGVKVVEHLVGLDGIAIIVHPDCPLAEITMEQLAKVFKGEVANWKDLGGPDAEIVACSRESSSGTYVFFQEHVLGKKDYGAKVRPLAATAAIITEVTGNKAAIGYVGLGYAAEAAGKVKVLPVKKDADSPAVAPSIPTVVDKSYPISRGLFNYTKGEPQGAVKAYLDWVKGDEGQAVLKDSGFVPVPKK